MKLWSSFPLHALRKWWPSHNEWSLLLAIVIAIIFTAIVDTNHTYLFRPVESLRDIARNSAMLGIFSLGAAVVIIAGGIDLSSGSMIALSGTVCSVTMLALAPAEMMAFKPVGSVVVLVAVLASLLTGFFVGTLHAWLITVVRLPPFIATLATLVGLRSFARAVCESSTAILTPTKSALINVADPTFKAVRDNVWFSVITFLVLAFFTWIMLSRTVLGRHLKALGGNEQAARLAGIRTENVKWFAYCFGAMTAALAGLFYVANESVAAPVNQGRGHELNAIAAAVVGGCSLSGGVGTVQGTILGALFLRVVIDAVSKIIKTGADVYEGLIVGVVVVLAVTFAQGLNGLRNDRRFLPGSLGLCTIPVLALLAGSLASMTTGAAVGLATGFTAFIVLAALRIWENRSNTKNSTSQRFMMDKLIEVAVAMKGITKQFPGVVALDRVSLQVRRGEVHAICGENGAGKSTLMKILSGVYQPDAGELEIAGRSVQFNCTRDAEDAGVAIIHQELELVEELSVAANVFLGREPRTRFGLLDDASAERKTSELLALLEAAISPGDITGDLRVGDQQLVEIAKASFLFLHQSSLWTNQPVR